jgi:hypothetical protein
MGVLPCLTVNLRYNDAFFARHFSFLVYVGFPFGLPFQLSSLCWFVFPSDFFNFLGFYILVFIVYSVFFRCALKPTFD